MVEGNKWELCIPSNIYGLRRPWQFSENSGRRCFGISNGNLGDGDGKVAAPRCDAMRCDAVNCNDKEVKFLTKIAD
jgi:hypothetical protein